MFADLRRARSFGSAAAEYERSRPGYPRAAVEWVLPAGVRRVLDLGAGTGKLTRALLDASSGRAPLGAGASGTTEVVALEPLAEMRELLRAFVAGVEILDGTAEAIPLADRSVDAVVAGQAAHWFDPERAWPEVARVLRPGGWLGLMWNDRDERVPWVAAFGRAVHGEDRVTLDLPIAPPPAALFGPPERLDVEWSMPVTAEELVGLAASRSHLIVRPEPERRAVLEDVRQLTLVHPDWTGRETMELPYVTQAWRIRRRSAGDDLPDGTALA